MTRTVFAKHALLTVGIGLWFAAAAMGTKQLNDYAFTPGKQGEAQESWPTQSAIRMTPNVPNLIVALHPECPCSRATLEELRALQASYDRPLQIILLFWDLDPRTPARESELYRLGLSLPHAQTVLDSTGKELQRFSFETSGETRVYRGDGLLLYAGGLTGSRGHAGDNPGRQGAFQSLHSSLQEAHPPVVRRPVFGCRIFDAASSK